MDPKQKVTATEAKQLIDAAIGIVQNEASEALAALKTDFDARIAAIETKLAAPAATPVTAVPASTGTSRRLYDVMQIQKDGTERKLNPKPLNDVESDRFAQSLALVGFGGLYFLESDGKKFKVPTPRLARIEELKANGMKLMAELNLSPVAEPAKADEKAPEVDVVVVPEGEKVEATA